MARSNGALIVPLMLRENQFVKGMHEASSATKKLDHSLDGLKKSQLAVRESALRVAAAEERLNKLRGSGTAHAHQLERAEIALEKAQLRQAAAQRTVNAQMTRGNRQQSMLATGLKNGARAAGTFIAAYAGLSIVKDSITAFAEAEKSQARMTAQLKASGIAYRTYAADIERVIQKTSLLAGLDDEDLQDAFTNIVRVTGDVNKSLRLTGLAADFARGKQINVAKAGEIVGKVAGGNVGILKRYGVQLEKGASASEALALLQKKFGGQAEAYGKTTAGSMDRLSVAAENLKERVGGALAPALSKAAEKLSVFLNQMQSGTGAGGRFVDRMRALYEAVRPIGQTILDVGRAVVSFVAQNPQVTRAAVAFLAVKTAIVAIGGPLAGMVTTMKALTAAKGLSGLAAAFAGLSNPIGLVGTLAAGAVAGLVLLGKGSDEQGKKARENARKNRELADAIRSVADANAAAADKGIAARQSLIDMRAARARLRELQAQGAPQDQIDTAKNDFAQAVLRRTAALKEYRAQLQAARREADAALGGASSKMRSALSENQSLQAQRTERQAMAQRSITPSTSAQEAFGIRRARADVVRLDSQIAASNENLASSTRNYIKAQARAATLDSDRRRMMAGLKQLTDSQAISVAKLGGTLDRLPKEKRTKILAETGPAVAKLGDYVGQLQGKVPQSRITQVILDSEDATEAARRLKAILDGLDGRTIDVKILSQLGFTTVGLSKNAAGRSPGRSGLALVGEGRGPEFVGNPRKGFAVVSSPTIMPLSARDAVIPTESRYRGNATAIMAGMLGLPAFAKGKKSDKQKLGLAQSRVNRWEVAWLLASQTQGAGDDLRAAVKGRDAANAKIAALRGLATRHPAAYGPELSSAINERDAWMKRVQDARDVRAKKPGSSSGVTSIAELADTPAASGEDAGATLAQILQEIRLQNQRAAALTQTSDGALAMAITNVISGQIGGRAGLRFQTPSYAGGYARY